MPNASATQPEASIPNVKPSLQRRAGRVLLTVAIVYLLLMLAIAWYQRSLIYFPTRLREDVALQVAHRDGILPWRDKAGTIIGWQWPANGTSTGTVLIVHGNAGCALDRDYLAKPIHETASVDVFVLEYPGYGAREGSPTQETLLAAADDAFAVITNRGPVFVLGESLGTGVAAHLAKSQPQRVSGLLLFAPYNNLISVAQKKMSFLPVGLILRDRYDPAAWLKDYRGPVGIVLAEADEVIPSEFGRRLYDGYEGPKDLLVIPGARHNDIARQSSEWWRARFVFWEKPGVK